MQCSSPVWNTSALKLNELEQVQLEYHRIPRIPSLWHRSYTERLAILDQKPSEVRRLRFDLIHYINFKVICFANGKETVTYSNATSLFTRSCGPVLVKLIYHSNKIANIFFLPSYRPLEVSLVHTITHASSITELKRYALYDAVVQSDYCAAQAARCKPL